MSQLYRGGVLLVFFTALISATLLLSSAEFTYIIKPQPEVPCPVLHSGPCLTLSEYADQEESSPNTTLAFLPGQHNLDQNVTIFGVTSFSMLGGSFSTPLHGDPVTTITCSSPVTLSFHDSQEVSLQGIEFIHCGGLHQPAIMVSSVQYFEMIECSVKDSRNLGFLASNCFVFFHNTIFNNNKGTGLIVVNGRAKFAGNITLSQNGYFQSAIDKSHVTDNFPNTYYGGGFAAFNSSIQFHGIAVFRRNNAEKGGGLYASKSTIIFRGLQLLENNTAASGGGLYIVRSILKMHNPAKICVSSLATIRCSHALQYETTFLGNHASRRGGGLYIYNSTLRSNNTWLIAESHKGGLGGVHSYIVLNGNITVKGNSAYSGGGVGLYRSYLFCSGKAMFNSNRAELAGGGVVSSNGSWIVFCNAALFLGNSASYGGGIAMLEGDLVFNSSAEIIENTASYGGGIFLHRSSTNVVGFLLLSHNTAILRGGGLIGNDSNIAIHGNATLSLNSAAHGGGMDIHSSELICSSNTLFINNSAQTLGGGFHGRKCFIEFYGKTTVSFNSALIGGGISIRHGTLAFSGTTVFDRNTAKGFGGGIEAKDTTCTLYGSVSFTGNTVRYDSGGGFVAQNSSVVYWGTTSFTGNTATISGGGYFATGTSTVFNGTTSFVSNTAGEGGGMYIQETNLVCKGTLRFRNNNGQIHGGGMVIHTTNVSSNGFLILDSNTAKYLGGGMAIFSKPTDSTKETQQNFSQSVTVANNAAKLGGGIASFHGNMSFSGNISFHNNSAGFYNGVSFGFGGGIYSYSTILGFSTETYFTENIAHDGGGMYLIKCKLFLDGKFSMKKNHVVSNGGGLYSASGSECFISEETSLTLAQNSAGKFGGAVYIGDDPNFHCINMVFTIRDSNQANCLFQPTTWPNMATIRIYHNCASSAGSAVYGGYLNECQVKAWNSEQQDQTTYLNWIFQTPLPRSILCQSSVISSDPTRVCPCISNQPYCNLTELNLTAFPGSTIYISVVATGQMNGTVPSQVAAKFIDTTATVETLQTVQSANNTCTTLQYKLSATAETDMFKNHTMSLLSDSLCNYGKNLKVNIQLQPCPSGFELNKAVPISCVCSQRIQRYTNTCDIDTQTILRHGHYWIGWDAVSNRAILHPHCPFDYCRFGNISFSVNASDKQCQHNRAGLLCGGCKQGYSLGLGNSGCLKCSNNSYLSLILVFALAGAVLVVFLLTFKLTVAMGTINGLIFYANIVAANQAIYFPQTNSKGDILRIFIAWINLDLGIETCFYRGMDMYTWTWLQFVFPLYIWTLVGIVIALSHYFSWVTRMLGNNPVAVLATLFLLSYAKALRTVIVVLSFTYLDYPDNPRVAVWLYDGNVQYLKDKHIALFIAALLVMTFLFLPYTAVILCRQWIEAKSERIRLFRWITNFRIKPFLDAYHGPFKNNHRYWPGLLLVIRALLLLVFAFNAFGDPSINLLATITCIIGLLTTLILTGSPYKTRYNYILELSFLVNIGGLAACTMAPALSERDQIPITYTSVGIAFTTFIGIFVYNGLMQIRNSSIWKDIVKPRLQCRQRGQARQALVELNEPEEGLVVNPRPESVVTETSINLRELLLEDEQY